MGNWRTVHMQGTCSAEDVPALRDRLNIEWGDRGWTCLHSGGLAGLQNWAAEQINAVGNLGERDYDPEDVADALRDLIENTAPSLKVRVDCGDDWESLDCVATVIVGEDSSVAVLPPVVGRVPEISTEVVMGRLYREMGLR